MKGSGKENKDLTPGPSPEERGGKVNKFFDIRGNRDAKGGVYPAKVSPNYTSKYLLGHYQKLEKLDKDLGRLPEREEFFFLQTDGAFNAFTFIPFVCRDFSVSELFASTYSISRRTIEAMVELHDAGVVEKITLLISDSMQKRNPVTMDLLHGLVRERPNIEVKYAWVHAKVCLLNTIAGQFVIEGSGNWSENAHYEQYVFANCKGLYEFRKELFTNINFK